MPAQSNSVIIPLFDYSAYPLEYIPESRSVTLFPLPESLVQYALNCEMLCCVLVMVAHSEISLYVCPPPLVCWCCYCCSLGL